MLIFFQSQHICISLTVKILHNPLMTHALHTTPHILIIGAGPAGYTAAIYSSRAGFKTTILTGLIPGGQLMKTTHIQNYPGHLNRPAPELMATMHQQCTELPIMILPNLVTEILCNPFRVIDDTGATHTPNAIIVATGADPKTLHVLGESEFMGRGISTCATCDGHFYRKQPVAVIGGGNTAVEEAIYLSSIASIVHFIHRRDALRAEHTLQQSLFALPNVQFYWNTEVQSFHGTQELTHVSLKNTTQNTMQLEVSAAFIAIGHTPNTAWCANVVQLDAQGYIQTYDPSGRISETPQSHTSTPGIFAAGDVCDSRYRQAITAAAQGCVASIDAQKWLRHNIAQPS